MSVALSNFLFEAANFVVLTLALAWVLFKPVRAALDRERERHASVAAESDEMHIEAEKLLEEAREIRAKVADEVERDRVEAVAAARRRAQRVEEESRELERTRRAQLEAELAADRRADARALAEAVGQIAARSVRELLGAIDAADLDAALVRAACVRVGDLSPGDRGEAVVESARPLETKTRELLADLLGHSVHETIVDELGAGVRITMGGGQVDATALGFARLAAREVAEVMTEDSNG